MKPAPPKSQADELNATFGALADPTRRQIVERLSRGRATVGEIVQPFNVSWPAVTKHLRVLERAGLVGRHRAGLHRILELNPEPLEQVQQWIEHHRQFWKGNLDSLADYLERGITKLISKSKRARK